MLAPPDGRGTRFRPQEVVAEILDALERLVLPTIGRVMIACRGGSGRACQNMSVLPCLESAEGPH